MSRHDLKNITHNETVSFICMKKYLSVYLSGSSLTLLSCFLKYYNKYYFILCAQSLFPSFFRVPSWLKARVIYD